MNTFSDGTGPQFPLCDPGPVRDNRDRFRRNMIPQLERANSFYCPSGRWMSRGWILLDRNSYNRLNTYSTDCTLTVSNLSPIRNLSIVQARCVTRGLANDPNALYLIELTDDRGILYNEWFQFPTVSAYNVRVPAYPQTFYPASMNGGTTWTWATMLQDMWNQMNALASGNVLGVWPGLPSAPAGTPEGFFYSGVPCWYALNDVLEHLGMTVACNPTQTNPFTIVALGSTDASFALQQTKYAPFLEDDLEWLDTGAGRVPLQVEVLFRRRNSIYGTEETVRYDSPFQWEMSPHYSVTINAPAIFTGAVGSHRIWSDYTVRYSDSGDPLDADVAMANTIAQERVTQYFNRIYRGTLGFMTQDYGGAIPFVTGSQVDGVCWSHHSSEFHDGRRGWRTHIVRGPNPPWQGLWD